MNNPTRTPSSEPEVRPESPELTELPSGIGQLAVLLTTALDRIAARLQAAEMAAAGIEPLVGIDEWAATLACSRREVERMRAAGKLPPPDLSIGRSPRWKAGTVRAWIDEQSRASGRGGRR
jgi:predicted DNA-binding transcriptional regulator AlpA